MSLDPTREQRLSALQEHLRRARTVTPALMAEVAARACPRFQALASAPKAKVLRQIESGAFADASLSLLALELPGWKLRRLLYEDGEWICRLSSQRELPDWLDDAAEAHHETLALAILVAFVEAQRIPRSDEARSPAVPTARPAAGDAVCCDNFA